MSEDNQGSILASSCITFKQGQDSLIGVKDNIEDGLSKIKNKHKKLTNKKPSVSGYGAYVNSKNKTAETCLNKGYWQYNFTKYVTFGKFITNVFWQNYCSTGIIIITLIVFVLYILFLPIHEIKYIFLCSLQ